MTGLHYYRARWYDANLGRFISEDPIGFAGGDINLFGYVWNNPQSFVDPTGLAGWGSNTADYFDDRIEFARKYYQPDQQDWVHNGLIDTGADLALGASDMLRVGNSTAQAFCDCDENIYGRAAFLAMDVQRASGLFSLLAGPFAKPAGTCSRGARFPSNPDDLLPSLPRDVKGRIYPSDKLRLRPEKHALEPGEMFNPRHHGQHYHVDYRSNPQMGWNNKGVTKFKPKNYKRGDGTGFMPGEPFP